MRRRTVLSTVAGLGALTALSACGGEETSGSATPASAGSPAGGADGTFPVTVEHAFGSTEITERPERVVTIGFNEQDYVLALGVTPVGTRAYFGYDYQTRPWAVDLLPAQPLPEVGGQTGVEIEQIAALDPDLLIGTYSFIDQPTYDTLSQIAPTVGDLAGEGGASSATWQRQLDVIGQALGRTQEAARLTTSVEAAFTAAAQAHPEFAGKVVSVVLALESGYYALDGTDPRGDFFLQLGFSPATVSGEVAAENVSQLDTDVLVVLGQSQAQFTANATSAALSAVAQGRTVYVDSFEGDFAGALGFSSPLSLPFAIDLALPQLALAADGDPATVPAPL